MRAAAANLDFEKAAALRDDIKRLRNRRARAAAAGPEGLTPRARRSSNDWLKKRALEVQEYVRLHRRVAARACVTPPFYRHDIVEQFDAIGVGSLTVVAADRVLHRRGAGAAERA